jgi:hypothetical protein
MKRRVAAWIGGIACFLAFNSAYPTFWAIETDPATGVTATSAVLNGYVYYPGSGNFAVRFEFGTDSGVYTDFYAADESPVPANSGTHVSHTVTGLTPGEDYYYTVSLYNGGWIPAADPESFTTEYPLSVGLASFSAQAARQGIILTWTTESECDNRGFTIERREAETSDWVTIADYRTDACLTVRGNSSERTQYTYFDGSVRGGRVYEYRISDTDTDGKTVIRRTLRVAYDETVLPSETGMDPAFPNPFNPETRVLLRITEPGPVSLTVLDANGRRIRTLIPAAAREAGSYDLRWDATDETGRAVPCGVYVILLRAGKTVSSQKVLYLK